MTGEERRQALQEQLGFPENSISYPAAGEYVIRSRNDTLHIAEDGHVTYEARRRDSDRYRLSGTGVYEAVEGCRRLAQQTLGQNSGEAALYLISAEENGEGNWLVEFGYSLNGAQVRIGEEGWAARFVVEQGQITDFSCGSAAIRTAGPPRWSFRCGRRWPPWRPRAHGGGAASGLSGRRRRGTGLRLLGGRRALDTGR